MIKRLRSAVRNRTLPATIRAVKSDSLTFLETDALVDLYEAVQAVVADKRPGILVEAGCAAGGSAIVMASAKEPERKLNVYDVFGMIPPPSAKDDTDVHKRYEVIKSGAATGLGDKKYYGYEPDLLATVKANFAKHGFPIEKNNVSLIKGLFEDTLNLTEPVALAHLDGDWFESVMVCLHQITPKLVKGGTLVIDDYFAWSGCRKAVDEYFADKQANYDFVEKSRIHIIRR
jgi:asparagine synthase (glutamine-hydrolysing)